MEELREILRQHRAAHPAMELRDEAKLIYQNELGGGHMISDPAKALERLRRELDGCGPGDGPLFEPVGNGSVRINLCPAQGRVSTETLFRMFYLSSLRPKGSEAGLREKLKVLYEFHDAKEVDAYLSELESAGYGLFSHSDKYRAAYTPAYRVIDEAYAQFFDVISAVDRFSRFAGPVFIGIDGMCASGKTTLGGLLAELFEANLFHADDYFLPPEKRTEERFAQPGGNMDRERLVQEVFEPISVRRPARTRSFDCGTMEYSTPTEHPLRRVNIVEGSYSLHPELRDFYTLKIATRTDGDTQLRRLAQRGHDYLGSFIARWIPLEEQYFAATGLYKAADMVVDT